MAHLIPKKLPSATAGALPASNAAPGKFRGFLDIGCFPDGTQRSSDFFATFSPKRRLCDEMAHFSPNDVWGRLREEYVFWGESLHGVACPGQESMRFIEKISGGDLAFFRGKRALDLGCGASDGRIIREASPTLCRFLHECGADVTGVDIRPQGPEKFRSHQLDLAKKGALDFLPSDSFDYIFCFYLIDFFGKSSLSTSPIVDRLAHEEKAGMASEIYRQAERLLCKGGVFMFIYNLEMAAMQKDRNGFLDYYSL